MREAMKRAPERSRHESDRFKSVTFGIIDGEIAMALGHLIAYWPNVEDRMVYFFHEVIFGEETSEDSRIQNARLIF